MALATLSTHGVSARREGKITDTVKIACTRHASYWATRGGRCGFRIVFVRDKRRSRWVASGKDSVYAHNHGPDSHRRVDPTWLPQLLYPRVRRALGLNSLDPSRKRKRGAKKHKATSDSESTGESSCSSDEASEAESSDPASDTSPSPSPSVSSPKRKRRERNSSVTVPPQVRSVHTSLLFATHADLNKLFRASPSRRIPRSRLFAPD